MDITIDADILDRLDKNDVTEIVLKCYDLINKLREVAKEPIPFNFRLVSNIS